MDAISDPPFDGTCQAFVLWTSEGLGAQVLKDNRIHIIKTITWYVTTRVKLVMATCTCVLKLFVRHIHFLSQCRLIFASIIHVTSPFCMYFTLNERANTYMKVKFNRKWQSVTLIHMVHTNALLIFYFKLVGFIRCSIVLLICWTFQARNGMYSIHVVRYNYTINQWNQIKESLTCNSSKV